MQKFKFEIKKVETQFAFLEIEAESEQEARVLALKKAKQGIEAFSEDKPILWDLLDKPRYSILTIGE
jgi:hypothetical protein